MTVIPSDILDAVAAVSTPPGKGGVAVIRISGADALAVAEKVFFPKNGKSLGVCAVRTQIYGDIRKGGERIDDGMATYFAAPRSFTGEDTVEISCHGGILVTAAVLTAVLSAGARMAEAGEFTRRAFLSGKLTLTEAEAIGDLLDAKSMGQVRLAAGEGKTKLSDAVAAIRRDLVETLSSLFARIDYPDEDLGDFTREQTLRRLQDARARVGDLLTTYRTGKAVNLGIRTVITGKPNVGKSTLYNALLGKDAAIVTDLPGTTRDTLTDALPLGDVLLDLTDTAGVRAETQDPIEAIGIGRAKQALDRAELILALFDASVPTDREDEELLAYLAHCPAEKIALITKSDLPTNAGFDEAKISAAIPRRLSISAKEADEEARRELTAAVAALFTDERIRVGEDAILSTARQNAALEKTAAYLDAAIAAFASGVEEDAAASEVERAISAVGELDGQTVSEEVVQGIFSRFCVGK